MSYLDDPFPHRYSVSVSRELVQVFTRSSFPNHDLLVHVSCGLVKKTTTTGLISQSSGFNDTFASCTTFSSAL